jgi:hypothetical protein
MADEVVLPEPLVVDTLEDVGDVWANLVALRDKINGQLGQGNLRDGAVTPDKISPELANLVSGGPGVVRRALVSNPEQQVIASTGYVSMPTPDKQPAVVLPQDGILNVGFTASVYETVLNAARIAIFVNGVQLRMADAAAGTAVSETSVGAATRWCQCYSNQWGLRTFVPTASLPAFPVGPVALTVNNSPNSGGFWCPILMTPGSYDVEVRYKASSGQLYASARRLWVQVYYPR